jgi:cytochrome P450
MAQKEQKTNDHQRSPRPIPGPKGHPLWGNTVQFTKDQLGFCTNMQRYYGDIARFTVIGHEWVQLSKPEYVYDVLVRRPELFLKPKINKDIFRLFLGNGVVSSDGDFWKRQHKMMLPGFHRKRIEAYGKIMVDYTERMISEWQEGQKVDFCHEMTDLTLGIVAKTLFDTDVSGEEAGTVRRGMKVINDVLTDHITFPLPVPAWWPSKANKRKMSAISTIDGIVQRIISDRRQSGIDHGDLLSMLVFAKSETGEQMNDKELRDEAMTLFFAGHETTSHALTWTWYLLGKHPEVAQKLYDEVSSVLGDRPVTVDDLPNLPYLDMVFKETMRILPSVWTFMREPAEDVEIGGYVIKKGSYIFISPYVMHNNPILFDKPDVFRPERFTREFEKNLPKGAYLPFSMGPRVCLGKSFAMMEARMIIATLIQRLHAQHDAGYKPVMNIKLALSPKNGLPITVRHRKAEQSSNVMPKRNEPANENALPTPLAKALPPSLDGSLDFDAAKHRQASLAANRSPCSGGKYL